jgi:hypothetical protein
MPSLLYWSTVNTGEKCFLAQCRRFIGLGSLGLVRSSLPIRTNHFSEPDCQWLGSSSFGNLLSGDPPQTTPSPTWKAYPGAGQTFQLRNLNKKSRNWSKTLVKRDSRLQRVDDGCNQLMLMAGKKDSNLLIAMLVILIVHQGLKSSLDYRLDYRRLGRGTLAVS